MPDEDRVGGRGASQSLTITVWLIGALSLVVLALALLVTSVLPYGLWDAMSFGTWSRLIAIHWPHLHPYGGTQQYQRPLFYVLQGFVWHVFGFHPILGRLLSFAFSLLLVLAVGWAAASLGPRPYRRLAGALAVAVLLILSTFEQYVAAGLSDIPAAALVGLTAALLCARRLGRAQLPLVALAALLSVLAKSSALTALAGLGLALLLGPRTDIRRRASALAAVVAGTALGLVYDIDQARYLHIGLRAFLAAGTGGFYARIADERRRQMLLDGSWLGPDLRVLLWFAIAYTLARIVRLGHRPGVAVAVPVAALWSWLGPHLAGEHGVRVGILGTGGSTEQAAVLLLTAALLFALAAPAAAVPDALLLARLLVWATPTLVLWGVYAVYDNRLLAPAWPALVLLITATVLPAFAGARERVDWLIALPVATVLVLLVMAVYNIDGLGTSGWRQLRSGGLSGLGDAALMRNVAFGGDFSKEMNALVTQVGPHERILTDDSRLQFFYLGQIDFQPPRSCSQITDQRVFVLLESDEERQIYGERADPSFWEACKNVKLALVAEDPGAFAIFVNGVPRPLVGGCGAPAPDQTMVIDFGERSTEAQAELLTKRLTAVGFLGTRIEQLGCSSYRVVEPGVPSEQVGQSILAEARRAHVPATLAGP